MTNEEKFKMLPFLDRGRWYQLFIEIGFTSGLASITLPESIDHAHIFIYGYFR